MDTITRSDVVPSHFYSSRKKTSEEPTETNCCLGVCNSLDAITANVTCSSSSFPNDIVIEILSRLLVKSLMQFKSVCKHWLSLIQQDQHLIDLHFTRSKLRPNLLYINPLHEKGVRRGSLGVSFEASKSLQQSISCAEMGEGSCGEEQVEAIVSKARITDTKWFLYNQATEPVNGLLCFIDWKTYAIRVYNASTREASPWVKSTLPAEEKDKLRNVIYRLGFDPEKKEHKIFCFWRLVSRRQWHRYSSTERHDYESWEALTVGRDTKWRRISAVPNENNQIKIKHALPPLTNNSSKPQLYADGTIYWSNKEYYWDVCSSSNHDDPSVIVAFDVGSEKYRVIPVPNFILDEARDADYRLPICMLVLGGHVAMLYRMEPYVVKLWMLDDGADKKLENCRGNQSNWSSETITLPFCCDHGIDGYGVAGCTDKILFERQFGTLDVRSVCLYSYDRREKSCRKIEMDGVSSFRLYSRRSLLATFTESLFPVRAWHS